MFKEEIMLSIKESGIEIMLHTLCEAMRSKEAAIEGGYAVIKRLEAENANLRMQLESAEVANG